MIKKLKGGIKQRIAAVILGVAVMVYAAYHVSSLFGEDIATITTGVSTESVVLDGKGYVFRDETVLYSDYTGVAEYLKDDGDKVYVGEALANISADGGAQYKNTVKDLSERIEILEESVSGDHTLADLPYINDQIDDAYYSLAKMLATGDTGGIAEQADKLLLNMNIHSIVTEGEGSPIEQTLSDMKERRDAIFDVGGGKVVENSPEGGYFYSYVDGYEESFTIKETDAVVNGDVSAAVWYYDIADGKIAADSQARNTAYGKLASSSKWRFVMRVDPQQTVYFKDGEEYRFKFVENGNVEIPMTLISSSNDDIYGGGILIFESNRLPYGFVFDRCQSISVTVDSRSGIYVPKDAVHRVGGNYYVYILKGSVVKQRRISIVFEGKDYYLSDADNTTYDGFALVGTNELLIIKGNDLFDGRILN